MCVEYELASLKGKMPAIVRADAEALILRLVSPRHIWPKYEAPVVLPDGSARVMSWGFRLKHKSKKPGGRSTHSVTANARDDKLKGWTWRAAFEKRRCVAPLSAFYERGSVEGKKAHLRIHRSDEHALWIAGFWELHDEAGECFNLITTKPNDFMRPYHDRMLAMLEHDEIEPYLRGELSDFRPAEIPLVMEVDYLPEVKNPPETSQSELL